MKNNLSQQKLEGLENLVAWHTRTLELLYDNYKGVRFFSSLFNGKAKIFSKKVYKSHEALCKALEVDSKEMMNPTLLLDTLNQQGVSNITALKKVMDKLYGTFGLRLASNIPFNEFLSKIKKNRKDLAAYRL